MQKTLIGRQAYERTRPDRVGTLQALQFANKDKTVCWFLFAWQHGAYLVPYDDLIILPEQNRQLSLFD